jgi:superfamily II DNA/RNA helicase/HKD family nuclease
MSTKIFTNKEENTLIKKFEGIFSYNANIQNFDALVGYFRASGYFRIRPFLDKIPHIRILVGINVDNLLANAQRAGLDFFKNQEKTKEEFLQEVRQDVEQADYTRETEEGILQFIEDIVQNKIHVKAHPDKKLHAKVYIFRPKPFNEHTPASIITGSSNLTGAGLGAGNKYNYEFNVQLNDYDDVKFATDEFEELWAEAIDILPADIQPIKKETYLNDEITPFELYIKLLTEYFGKNIDYDPDSIGDVPQNFKKLSYQVDAVNEGFSILMKHNGFVLADVVGLGKTVVAALVAQKFLMQNGRDYSKILVVYPPAVEKNWKNTFKDFKLDKYTKFITNGSLDKIVRGHQDYWAKEEYDLVIVDEAHKFRNHTTGAFDNLQKICKSPRTNVGMIEGFQKKVILVSATPLNNRPEDIYHQISMFQDLRQSSLPVPNLTSFFAPLTEQYKSLKRSETLDVEKLRRIYDAIRKNVIEPITIRRTRKDLENIPAYKQDLQEQGIIFPKVEAPKKLEYVMDDALNELFYKTVEYLTSIDKITYSRYQAIAALKETIPSLDGKARKELYAEAETVSKSLASIMKNQLIKRLESSFYAFRKSLQNFKTANERMITMFENDKVFIAPDTNVNALIDKGWSDEEIEEEIGRLAEDNPKNQTFKANDFEEGFLDKLKQDAEFLHELVEEWDKIPDDPKLKIFVKNLEKQFLGSINHEKKLVIFSESKETTRYLEQELTKRGRHDVLLISSENRKAEHDTIVENFDANFPTATQKEKGKTQKNDYNIIITTEVLAEGVNLHRSNVIVHYDTPWNSTRLIQRIGRVNRIGTKASAIHNFVFYPSAQGEEQLRLNRTAFMKLQAFHTAFGEDNQILSTDEILDDAKLFSGQYKEDEDERLKYLHFLRTFKQDHKARFDAIKKIPLKSRTGRNAENAQRTERKGGTGAFMKTSKKFEFYWVNADNKSSEITPIEAFKIFEAEESELSVELIETHHEHVQTALKHFERIEQQSAAAQITVSAAGGVSQQAKSFLLQILKQNIPSEQQKITIRAIIALIDVGRFTNLPTEIDRLRKKTMTLPNILTELDKISRKYDIDALNTQASPKKNVQAETAILIISESFA